ncbi:MAG: hypothetical protein RL094_560 [Candidatus Parcubacteria bacterium]
MIKYLLAAAILLLNIPFIGFRIEGGVLSMNYIFSRMWPLVVISLIVVAILLKYYQYFWVKLISVFLLVLLSFYVYAIISIWL